MKADYKNWMPKGMVASFVGGTAGALAAEAEHWRSQSQSEIPRQR